MSNIEIEARALLSPVERDRVLTYMRTVGEVLEVKRVMIDFSKIDRTKTVVLRINNGQQSLVAKTGGLTDIVRHESEVLIDPSQRIEDTLDTLATLGYSEGMISLRRMFVTRDEQIEYSIRDVVSLDTNERVSTLLDVEALNVAPGAEEDAQEDIRRALSTLNVAALTSLEWKRWVEEIYKTVDQPFGGRHRNAYQYLEEVKTFLAV